MPCDTILPPTGIYPKNVTREVDQKELFGLLADLDAKAQSAGAGEA